MKITRKTIMASASDYDREPNRYDDRYIVEGYYYKNFSGLAHSMSTNDWSEACDAVHAFVSDGDYVEFTDNVTGKSIRTDYDSYFESFDETGEFPFDVTDLDPNYFD